MGIGNYRAKYIDYRKPGIFLITMAKNDYIPMFSSLYPTGKADRYKGINTAFFRLGKIIRTNLENFKYKYPEIKILQFVVMPDHVHFILQKLEKNEKHLDDYMQQLKLDIYDEAKAKRIVAPKDMIFRPGYNDQFLTHKRSLRVMFEYIWENPYRLWTRKNHPEFFTRIENGELFGIRCQFYGNMNLLKNPFIYSVIWHSYYSPEEKISRWELWRYALKNDGVLAGAFIHQEEKKFLKEALSLGSKIILFRNFKLEEREKPQGKLFQLCETGKLLIISPEFPTDIPVVKGKDGRPQINKPQSRFMNLLAERLENQLLPPPADRNRNGP